jgi:ubiquinol-cytochrome c reductase iron-sulfur subunit
MRRGGWWFWLLALLGFARRERRDEEPCERIVEPGLPAPRAELATIVLLALTAACAIAFVVFYGVGASTQVLGASLAGAFAFLAAALILVGKRLVVTEELAEEYPGEHPEDETAVAQILEESGSRMTRKRLLGTAAGVAAGSIGVALAAPAVSLGPLFDSGPLYETPWRRGRRLVDEHGKSILASDIESGAFYTAYPQGASRKDLGAPLVVIRLDPATLELPSGREGWAPGGILAFSKICTHAGCAIALYRHPLFDPSEPRPALVCPCHYSTFDPARGAEVIFGPAGRPLPQLPLMIGTDGALRAAGNYSGAVGPAWSKVRSHPPRSV